MARQKNITLGKGELHFAPFVSGTQTPVAGERYLGNSTEFNFSQESATLDHFESDHGINVTDDSVQLSTTRNGNFVLDDIQKENLAMFINGAASTVATSSATGLTDTFTAVEADRWYQLGVDSSNPTGLRGVTTTAVTDGAGTPVPYTVTDDYVVDAALGRVYIPAGSSAIGAIVKVTYDIAATSAITVLSGQDTVSGQLRFISFNPKGLKRDYLFPYVNITPNGDFALKGDDWQNLPFNIAILQKAGAEAIYIDGRPGEV